MLNNNDPREFSCMDDSPENMGWGYNSELRYRLEPRRFDEEDDFWDDVDFPIEKENTVTIQCKDNWVTQNTEQ